MGLATNQNNCFVMRVYRDIIKRAIDLFVSMVLLVLTSPFIIVLSIGLHFANKGGGAFFLQERPGKNSKIFKIIKFKTMTDERDSSGLLLPDEQRLTKIGRFVRSISFDELPQLINVLKGDMSLIGPRPLLVQYLPLYSKDQARRHEVRPGISGWAQVHGRNLLLLSKKFEYDVWYVDHCSFVLDCKIAWMTIKNIVKCSDIGEGAGNMAEVDDLHFAERMAYK